MTRAHWIGIIGGGLVLAGTAAGAFHMTPEVTVETAPVTSGAIARRVVATGTVQPFTTVEVGAQVSGLVQSLDADFNSTVRAGQVIARLDPSLYQAALDQARGALAGARAAEGQAVAGLAGFRTAAEDEQMKLQRATELWRSHLITDADLDAAGIAMDEASADVRSGDAALNDARAGVTQARASVDQASVNLAHTIIRSPIDGVVIDRAVDVGQTVASAIQTPVLFRIATALTHVQLQVDIDESDVDGLAPGEPVTFDVESYPGETFRGRVNQLRLQPVPEQTTTATTIATSTTVATSTLVATVVSYAAIIDVPNDDQRLRPGMTAEVTLTGARRTATTRIPNGALSFRPSPDELHALRETEPTIPDAEGSAGTGGPKPRVVWQFDGRRFTPVVVQTGLADDHWTELLGGSIHSGDAVVTSAEVRQRTRI
jgi:HlyD family secretion protein